VTFAAALFGRVPVEPTERHLSRHGRPAEALGGDMPAYESERGAILLMESLIVHYRGAESPPLLFPRSYAQAVVLAPTGDLTALHHDPAAIWSWRPVPYRVTFDGGVQRFGSQQEQEYRVGIAEADQWAAERSDRLGLLVAELLDAEWRYRRRKGGLRKNARKRVARRYADRVPEIAAPVVDDLPSRQANDRARALLLEHLSPQQRLDLAALGHFHVRGELNRLYRVEPGNGFSAVDPVTHEQLVCCCLHPEEWIPDADVALATKLAIDAGRETEGQMLEGANARPVAGRTRRQALPGEIAAWEREEHYRVYP
jgi:hypothetical protein